jgi:mono/diheme cytochrome c family protein
MMRRHLLARAVAIAALLVPSAMPRAQSAVRTVWSGVYTPEQAARGRRQFEQSCVECHGADLAGLEGPPLAGREFFEHWREDTVDSLFAKIQTRMPPRSPGSLSRETTADLVAFLLEANEFPAGAAPLPIDSAALASIRIEGRDGPAPVPNFALVLSVGCLIERDGRWSLANATAPVRTRDTASTAYPPDAHPPAGRETILLRDAAPAKPDRFRARLVEAKGLLMRDASGSAINVTALQSIAATCP